MKIQFRKEIVNTIFHNPRANFEITRSHCEIRYDPLTNHVSRIFPSKKLTFHGDRWEQIAGESKSSCPFCPENMGKATPRFPKEFIPDGRLQVGQSYVIPNLSVYESF